MNTNNRRALEVLNDEPMTMTDLAFAMGGCRDSSFVRSGLHTLLAEGWAEMLGPDCEAQERKLQITERGLSALEN